VRDDGKGIDPEILKAGGRAGHCGLPGIRKRASRFGGNQEFWSKAGAGTEAGLTVPACNRLREVPRPRVRRARVWAAKR
jgi:signal transduction histidine kinase